MGFKNTTSERKIYASIYGGKFEIKAKEGEVAPDGTKAVSRISENQQTKETKTVWGFHYAELSGILENVVAEESTDFGWQFILTIQDPAAPSIVVTIPASSKYGRSLALTLPNLKKGQMVTLKPYNFEDKEKFDNYGKPKKVVGMNVFVEGEKVTKFYTKENPNGYPNVPEEESKTFDKDDWKMYGIKVDKFLRNEVNKWSQSQTAEPVSVSTTFKVEQDEDGENLPF